MDPVQKELRKKRKALTETIGNLVEDHCESCTKIVLERKKDKYHTQDKSGYCVNYCAIGKRLNELGDELTRITTSARERKQPVTKEILERLQQQMYTPDQMARYLGVNVRRILHHMALHDLIPVHEAVRTRTISRPRKEPKLMQLSLPVIINPVTKKTQRLKVSDDLQALYDAWNVSGGKEDLFHAWLDVGQSLIGMMRQEFSNDDKKLEAWIGRRVNNHLMRVQNDLKLEVLCHEGNG